MTPDNHESESPRVFECPLCNETFVEGEHRERCGICGRQFYTCRSNLLDHFSNIGPQPITSQCSLQPFQNHIVQTYAKEPRRSLIVNLPWGAGKTIVALAIAVTFLQRQPNKKVIYTVAKEGCGELTYQAFEMAQSLGFLAKVGGGYNPDDFEEQWRFMPEKQKAVLLAENPYRGEERKELFRDKKMERASIWFDSAVRLARYLQRNIDSWGEVGLVIVDEATDMSAKEYGGLRPSRYYQTMLKNVQHYHIPVIALTATIDQRRLSFLMDSLPNNPQMVQLTQVKYLSQEYTTKLFEVPTSETVEAIHQFLLEQIQQSEQRIFQGLNLPRHLARYSVVREMAFNISSIGSSEGLWLFNPDSGKHEYISISQEQVEGVSGYFQRLLKLLGLELQFLNNTAQGFSNAVEKNLLGEKPIQEVEAPDKTLLSLAKSYATEFGESSPKLELVIEKIKEADEKRTIIITRFRLLAHATVKPFLKLNPKTDLIFGGTKKEIRVQTLVDARRGQIDYLVLNNVGNRGLDLPLFERVIHLDITTNADHLFQRRSRIRGGEEWLVYYPFEKQKIKSYLERIKVQPNTKVEQGMMRVELE